MNYCGAKVVSCELANEKSNFKRQLWEMGTYLLTAFSHLIWMCTGCVGWTLVSTSYLVLYLLVQTVPLQLSKIFFADHVLHYVGMLFPCYYFLGAPGNLEKDEKKWAIQKLQTASTGHGMSRLSVGVSLIQYFKPPCYQKALAPKSANSWGFLNLKMESEIKPKT